MCLPTFEQMRESGSQAVLRLLLELVWRLSSHKSSTQKVIRTGFEDLVVGPFEGRRRRAPKAGTVLIGPLM